MTCGSSRRAVSLPEPCSPAARRLSCLPACQATGSPSWSARPPPSVPRAGLELTTAFRLDHWRDKGLPQLIAAVAALGRDDVRLTVCGSGEPSADLLAHVGGYPWCTVRPGLTDSELAAQFASCDLFVLATRTRSGRRSCGEGFGLVLLEAQVAGTAVVGPAHGGSPGAYLDGVTGATPRDESVAALTRVLDEARGSAYLARRDGRTRRRLGACELCSRPLRGIGGRQVAMTALHRLSRHSDKSGHLPSPAFS